MMTWPDFDEYRKTLLTLRSLLISLERRICQPEQNNDPAFMTYRESMTQFRMILENVYDLQEDILAAFERHQEHLCNWLTAKGPEKVLQWTALCEDYPCILRELSHYCNGNTLACCAIVRNEANYIKEWLEYHKMVGVTKFFLYDNESTDSLYEVLQPYIENNLVIYQPWPGEQCQLSAYNDAIKKYKDDVGYIAFIDADEFIVPVEDKLLPNLLIELMSQSTSSEALGVNWRVYGSSHHMIPQNGLVTENYTWRTHDMFFSNRCIKSIVNPRKTKGFLQNPHRAAMMDGTFCISEYGTAIITAYFQEGRCDKIRINHYCTKSKNDFIKKMLRGYPDQPHITPPMDEIEYRFLKYDLNSYAMEDRIMDRYIARLRDLCFH